MLMTKERRPAIRTLRGWAISILQEAGAIRECEEHGWMQDRADPHARARAFVVQPDGIRRRGARPDEAVAEVCDVWIRSATPVPSARRNDRGGATSRGLDAFPHACGHCRPS